MLFRFTLFSAHLPNAAPAGRAATLPQPMPRMPRWLFLSLLLLGGAVAHAADTLVATVQTSHYNGYQVSCFGMKDGWITVNATGGVPPYAYKWSNGAGTATITDLAAGYYRVAVVDQDGQMATVEATLEQPLPMKLDVDVYEYPNGYNLSCYDCNNGNAAVVVLGGAAPFTIDWSDGPTGANRYNLAAKGYGITVTDANACQGVRTAIYLRGPDRSDWGMTGNAGTQPGPHFIGTTDNKDLVLKTNGQARLKLEADGTILFPDTNMGVGPMYRGEDGVLRAGNIPEFPGQPCTTHLGLQYWASTGNAFDICPELGDSIYPLLGTTTNHSLAVITSNHERMLFTKGGELRIFNQQGDEAMRVSHQGKVGIGTIPASNSNYRLFVEGGIATRDVQVKLGAWPDYVFQQEYPLMPLDEFRRHLREKQHLPGIPSAAELEARQGLELGDMQRRMLRVVEEQALYILQLEERQVALEQRLDALEAARH